MLASDTASHAKHSGYTALSQHIPSARLLVEPRRAHANLLERVMVGILSRTLQSRWYRLGSLKVELRARRILREGFRGIAHILWGENDWGFLHRTARKTKTPLCVTFHTGPDTQPQVFNHPALLKRLDALILMSEVQRSFFESCGVSQDRIHVVHHGVDCRFFRPAEQAGHAPFQVVSVGNYRRNFLLLREVCERLRHDSAIRFTIVGPDFKRSLFADLGNVDFHSNISDEELRSLYQKGGCMLMTVEAATANNALLEAMACGLPVVAEDVGGLREYTGATAAVLHPAGNAEALAASIVSLSANPSLRHSMASAARARALELDWPTVAKHTVAIYHQLLGTMPA